MSVQAAAVVRDDGIRLSAPSAAYIKSGRFDATLLIAPAFTGLVAGAAVVLHPPLFAVLLIADLWLLGYHHVVATYTRLAFDKRSFLKNRFLALDLLIIVTVCAVVVSRSFGTWVIATAFLYLQWFHYMRQSYGIARMYFRSTPRGQVSQSRDLATDAVMYLVPIYGIAQRSSTMGDVFLGMPVKALVLPEELVAGLGFAAAVAVAAWWVRTGVRMVRGESDQLYAGFVMSHVVIFMAAYILIADANTGWLAINIWHNFQYVLVVWMVNAKRYAAGVDPEARFLSTISQPNRVAAYFASCLAISTFAYLNLNQLTTLLLGGGLAATVGIYMGVNFHHYFVDAMIWKRRRVPVRAA